MAARIAALRGHKFTLVEAAPDLGGQILLARQAPYRHTMGDILEWQENQLRQLDVEIKLNTYLEAADIQAEDVDTVIVATGSTPAMDGFNLQSPGDSTEGVDQAHVMSSHDIFYQPDFSPSGTVVVSDDVGHYEGIVVAEALLERGASKLAFVAH